MNPPKAERAKPSLSSDYNLLFKNKIGESSLDIHRTQVANFLERALINLHLNIAGTDIRAAGFVEGVKELISTIINIGTK